MKKLFIQLSILILCSNFVIAKEKPRVFIFTDINIDSGDPDDRQSLIHLFWYADELQIEGIVPERWNAKGYEACKLVVNAYAKDYKKYKLKKKDYPNPASLQKIVAKNWDQGKKLFNKTASKKKSPLYILIWGNMLKFKDALFEKPELASNLRVITIGTGVMLEKDMPHLPKNWEKSAPCKQMNWNAFGRNDIYNDPRFNNMWWLELNWTYNGMFTGPEPAQMLKKLSVFGSLGQHMKECVKNESWAQYFRVGDTPTVLYVIDPNHNLDNPIESSWAGKFTKPFPATRPNYYADFSDPIEWDYANPCNTWQNHMQVRKISTKTLEDQRDEMYNALLKKLSSIYK